MNSDQEKCDALSDYYSASFNDAPYNGPSFTVPGTVSHFTVEEHSVYFHLNSVKCRGVSQPRNSQSNPCVWASHCSAVLRRARRVFYVFRNYYSKYSPGFIWLVVYKSAVFVTLFCQMHILQPSLNVCKNWCFGPNLKISKSAMTWPC